MKTGYMLINLGSPDSPDTADVRRYLRQFLSDPRVIDISPIGRWLLLNLVILPFRPKQSGAAYREIWTERGSPLVFHGRDLVEAVQERLGDEVNVTLGMRYGSPSIREALAQLTAQGAERIVALPLFPQYSSAAWGSAAQELFDVVGSGWNVPPIEVRPVFYEHPGYIGGFVSAARHVMEEGPPVDKVLFSFHGVPERHCSKSAPGHCFASESCCDAIVAANRDCYRAQCFASARAMAGPNGLALDDGAWEVTFQSRLGRTPWVQPYTDVRVQELARAGARRVVVLSPSFVADCLETLEEIAMRAAEDFRAHSPHGDDARLDLVPSLNASGAWADAVAEMLTG